MANPVTWKTGEKLGPADLNSRIRDVNVALSNPAYAILSGSTAWTYTGSSTVGAIPFTTSASSGMTVTTSGAKKTGVTVVTAGVYDVELNITAEMSGGDPDSHLIVFIGVNGTFAARGIFAGRTDYQQTAYTHRLLKLNAGDVVTASVFTDSGKKVNFGISTASMDGCRLSMVRISNNPFTDQT
ncbi:hypothetical protein [Streptomyces californicus]|uniref:hypothetical protein n=1 Tax=Streptomyces californicus TaxID=67351 RepID=UPI0036B9C57A